jgi:DNA modification methylase
VGQFGHSGQGEILTDWRNRIIGHGNEPLDEILFNPANWRIHPKAQQQALEGVLDQVGWVQDVIINQRTGHLVDGHLRCQVAARNGEKTVPAVFVDLSEDEEALILASIDPLSAMAATDKAKLDELLHAVQSDDARVQEMISGLAEREGLEFGKQEPADAEPQIDRAAELNEKWQVKTGDLFRIGDHRLLCGDSTKREDVERVMGGEKADLLFTSPPYGQQRDYTDNTSEIVKDWDGLMDGVFSNIFGKENIQIIVNLGLIHKDNEWQPYYDSWIEWMRSNGWKRFGLYIWDQGFGLMGDWNGRLAPSFEFIFHFNKISKQPNKIVEKHEDSIKVKHGEGLRKKDGSIGKLTNPEASLQTHKIPDSVVRIFRSSEKIRQLHPAVFSLSFAEFNVETWSNKGELVYEPFCGSGTTMVACENLNRKCRAIEISPNYCAVILERMQTAFPDIEIEILL